jgi:hypothetical protein
MITPEQSTSIYYALIVAILGLILCYLGIKYIDTHPHRISIILFAIIAATLVIIFCFYILFGVMTP